MSSAKFVAVLSVFGFGMVCALLGSIGAPLRDSLGIGMKRFATLASVLLFTQVFMVLIVGMLLDRLGHRKVITAGFLGTAVTVILVGSLPTYGLMVVAMILLGVCGSCLNSGGNTLLPALRPDNPAAASNLGNVFFGLGALAIANLADRMLRVTGLGWTMALIGVLLAIPALLAWRADYPSVSAGFRLSTALRLLKNIAVWMGGLALFFYIGLEMSIMTYVKDYLGSLTFTDGAATVGLSLFILSLVAGRLLASQLHRYRIDLTKEGPWVMLWLALAAALVLAVMIDTRSKALAMLLVVLVGLSFSALFPTTVGVTFKRLDPSVYGSVFGVIFAIGLVGGSITVGLVGQIAEAKKAVQAGMNVLVGAAVGLAVIGSIMARIYWGREAAPAALPGEPERPGELEEPPGEAPDVAVEPDELAEAEEPDERQEPPENPFA